MRISHKYKFIFISIIKTGSTSVRDALNNYSDIFSGTEEPYLNHVTSERLKDHFDQMEWDWNNYFTFTFTRNPWDRFVSLWSYSKGYIKRYEENPEKESYDYYMRMKKLFPKYDDFKLYARDIPGFPSVDYCFDKHGKKLVNYIGKVENLQEDFNIVCDKIGIPHQQLPHKNKSKHKHYTEYYDDETREIVAKKYKKDIEYFGYKFGQ